MLLYLLKVLILVMALIGLCSILVPLILVEHFQNPSYFYWMIPGILIVPLALQLIENLSKVYTHCDIYYKSYNL